MKDHIDPSSHPGADWPAPAPSTQRRRAKIQDRSHRDELRAPHGTPSRKGNATGAFLYGRLRNAFNLTTAFRRRSPRSDSPLLRGGRGSTAVSACGGPITFRPPGIPETGRPFGQGSAAPEKRTLGRSRHRSPQTPPQVLGRPFPCPAACGFSTPPDVPSRNRLPTPRT